MIHPEFKVGDRITPTHEPAHQKWYRLIAGKPYTILNIVKNSGLMRDIWSSLYVLDVSGHNEFVTTGFKLYEEPEQEDMDELHRLFEEKVKSLL